MSWFKKKTNKKESGNRLRGPCSRQSSSSCSQRQMFLTHFCPEEYQLDLWLRRLRDVVTKRFTSGLLIFVLAPDISTIILAFLRRRFSTESGFNSGKFLSYLAISLLLKGLTLTATLTASSVDIFCSFRYQMCVHKNGPFKWVFVSCSFLVSCFLVVKRCKVSRCIGRPRLGSVSPGGIGQNCLQAQLRSVQGPRGSSCVSN